MKRSIVILLTLTLFLSVLAACGNGDENRGNATAPDGSDTVADTEESRDTTDDLDAAVLKAKYNGGEFTVAGRNGFKDSRDAQKDGIGQLCDEFYDWYLAE